MYQREKTRPLKINNVAIGGQNKVIIQSMTNTKTKDVKATVKQIKSLEDVGCEIIRVAVLDMEDALAIQKIKEAIRIPLVADIHFNPDFALAAIKSGADKIRLNPGNIEDEDKIKEVVALAKDKKVAIRIGINGGSLNKKYQHSATAMI